MTGIIITINNHSLNLTMQCQQTKKAFSPYKQTDVWNQIVASPPMTYLWLQVRDWETRKDWYRSKSTTLLHSDEEEGVNSCSTLSDEDSTPHVSR